MAGPLANRLATDGPRPVYLIQGAERMLADEAARQVLEAAVGSSSDPMTITRVDLGDPGVGGKEVLAACRSISLFDDRSAVVVRNADVLDTPQKQKLRDELAAYCARPNPATTLILRATKLKGTSKLYKAIKKTGEVLAFGALKQRDVGGWVQAEARRLGHKIDTQSARLIGELVGTSLLQLRLAVDQLSLYVGPGEAITTAVAETVLSSTRAHGVFELVDAVSQHRTVDALRHLRSMLEHREPPLRILAMLTRQFRLLWLVTEARNAGRAQSEVVKTLGLHPYVGKNLWEQGRRFPGHQLRRAYELVYDTDRDLKSSAGEDVILMEQLVMRLSALGA